MKSYVCVLSTDNYLDGVLVLNENLKFLKSKYDLLCIINEGISEQTKKILEYFKIKYLEINNIKYNNYTEFKDYWKNTFDKLNVFSLTNYEKLVYLDSDLLILENIDNLFECPHLSCPKDLPFKVKGFNSGIMVLEPNEKDFNNLRELARESNKNGRQISDQDIINEYFKKIKPLEYGYNIPREIREEKQDFFNCLTLKYESRYKMLYFLNDSKFDKIIHYIGKLKPFMINEHYSDDYSNLYMFYLTKIRKIKHRYYYNSQDELVSIIVPIYNKDNYLERCLNSIINQTYKNIEIILVNDGSTDNSLKTCKKYQKIDKRIKIINQKNLGVSAARNNGLNKATGEFISFVDSDDYISIDMIEVMVLNIKKYNADFIQCGTIINEKEKHYCFPKNQIFYDNENITLDFLNKNISGTVWDKLYRKQFIKKIKFEIKYNKNEDSIFMFEVIKIANTFLRIGNSLYHYTYQKEDSLTGNFSLIDDYNLFEYMDKIKEYIEYKYPKYKKSYNLFEFVLLRYMFEEISKLDMKTKIDKEDKCVKEVLKRLKKIDKNTN